MSAQLSTPLEAALEAITPAMLPAVLVVEHSAYSHPWTWANFIDSISAGYHCQALIGPSAAPGEPDTVIGYFVAMQGVDEVHLLNLTVAPAFQCQGWAPLLLETLVGWSRTRQAQWLWLEVRASNERALAVYDRNGFRRVGQRKGYYPGVHAPREDAIVMSRHLNERASAWGALA